MNATTRINDNAVRVSCNAGCGRSFEVPLTIGQEAAWRGGALIQRVTSGLDPDQRELLISGTCSECWNKLFSNEDEE